MDTNILKLETIDNNKYLFVGFNRLGRARQAV